MNQNKGFLAWMDTKDSSSKPLMYLVDIITIFFSLFIRYGVSLFPYSGKNTPPVFGDYEAHRHWMEITLHLPIHQWYTYKLEYWKLDYPPLLAYMSYFCGRLGNPSWFRLTESMGFEDADSFYFMRMTVFVMYVLVYYTAVRHFVMIKFHKQDWTLQRLVAWSLLMQPALILIDHGHFQYNCVMLGLTLWAIGFIWGDQLVWGICFLVLSMCFNHLSLYYIPACFCYLIGVCWKRRYWRGIRLGIQLGCVGILTMAACFLPFLTNSVALKQVIYRLFPIERDIDENIVANIWYSLSTLITLLSILIKPLAVPIKLLVAPIKLMTLLLNMKSMYIA
jgi:alpha-1,3-glucosyltransferase